MAPSGADVSPRSSWDALDALDALDAWADDDAVALNAVVEVVVVDADAAREKAPSTAAVAKTNNCRILERFDVPPFAKIGCQSEVYVLTDGCTITRVPGTVPGYSTLPGPGPGTISTTVI